MENNNLKKEYWGKSFYGSKLNTVLLLILIVLMIFAVKIMLSNEALYFPYLENANKTEQQSQKISIDYLENKIPLYAGVSWQNQIVDDTYSNVGLRGESVVSSEYFLRYEDKDIRNKFREFYSEEMVKLGYVEDLEIAADGPGESQWGYKSGANYIILSYKDKQIIPQINKPFDCPCTEQLKVFLGQKI